jgi:hypothetical protein
VLHKTSQERYEKLKKVFARLMEHFNADDLDEFVQTANSLREWIRRDGTLTQEQSAALERFVVEQSLDWQICHQVANHQKHVNARPRLKARLRAASILVVKDVHVKPGRGTGFVVPPSMRVFGAGDEIDIECDGRRESALAFVIRTFKHFHYIFEMAPIPPSQRVIPTFMQLISG